VREGITDISLGNTVPKSRLIKLNAGIHIFIIQEKGPPGKTEGDGVTETVIKRPFRRGLDAIPRLCYTEDP
jgi:hypothetical protein